MGGLSSFRVRAKLYCPGTFGLSRRGIVTCARPVKLAYTTYGSVLDDHRNAPLVICHGLFGQKSNWNSVSKAVQRRLGNVVYAVDMRNHGDSPHDSSMTYVDQAADLALFLSTVKQQTGFSKAHILGHSMGGKAVMRLAIDPQGGSFIDRLIVEDVSPKGYTMSSHAFRYYVQAMKSADLTKTRQEIGQQLERDVPDLAVRQFLLTNLKSSPEGGFQWKPNLDSISRHFEDILGISLPVGAFRGRTLFIYGEKSGYVPHEDRPIIKNLFPQVEFSEIKESGHWVHADQPALFIDSICNFIETK